MRIRNVAAVTSVLVVLGVFAACSAQADPPGGKGGTPQNPCYGNQSDCVDSDWYITRIKVGERQVTCISHDYRGTGQTMSCDWPQS